jgi:hypothetical protein
MKTIILITVGFLLHKGLYSIYAYSWWSAEATPECRTIENDIDPYRCIHEKMGVVNYLKYPLVEVGYPWKKWELQYP